jgi:hypothetical protein
MGEGGRRGDVSEIDGGGKVRVGEERRRDSRRGMFWGGGVFTNQAGGVEDIL